MMTNKEIIEVITAFEAGEEIEAKPHGTETWLSGCTNPAWNFGLCTYRVARKPLEMWANVYDHGVGTFPTDEAAKQAAKYSPPIRTAIQLREVV